MAQKQLTAPKPKQSEDEKTKATELVGMLSFKSEELRAHAMKSLVGMGEKAAPALVEVLKKTDTSVLVRQYAMDILSDIGDRAIPSLRYLIQYPGSATSRENAADTIGKIAVKGKLKEVERAADALIIAFKDENPEVAKTAFWAMWNLKERAVPYLLPALSDSNRTVRFYSAAAIGRIAGMGKKERQAAERALPKLEWMSKNETSISVMEEVRRALNEFRKEIKK